MADKLIGAAILGVTIALYVWARDQELFALHENAYLGFTLVAIVLSRRASA